MGVLKIPHEGLSCSPFTSHILSHTVGLGKVHQRVGRLIKVYVAYLKTHTCWVMMVSVEVSKGHVKEGEGRRRNRTYTIIYDI